MKISAPVANKSAPPLGMGHATVLVVDDESLIRWSVKERLAHDIERKAEVLSRIKTQP